MVVYVLWHPFYSRVMAPYLEAPTMVQLRVTVCTVCNSKGSWCVTKGSSSLQRRLHALVTVRVHGVGSFYLVNTLGVRDSNRRRP